jgi:hypothetical protein
MNMGIRASVAELSVMRWLVMVLGTIGWGVWAEKAHTGQSAHTYAIIRSFE